MRSKILQRALPLILCMEFSALAQTRMADVTGTVLDPSGASTPGALVILRQGKDRQIASVATDLSGTFVFKSVPPGTYSIEIQHEGFKTAIVELRVAGSRLAPLTVTLALAEISSEVSVNGAEAAVSTEIGENLDAAAMQQSALENLPVFDQDYLATMSAFLDASATGNGGAQLIVDGMAATNLGVSSSAIQEVRINQNPYSAEYARPGRGSIEVITKAGTTQYHGTLNFIFRDSLFNARDAFALVRPNEQRRIFEGALTGPVGQGQVTSFLLSGHRQEEDLESIVFATGVAGPIRENVASPRRDTQLSFRLSHQFSPGHTVFWQYNEWDYPSSNLGVGGFVLPEAARNSKQWEREAVFNHRFTLSPRWLNQFQILVGRERHQITSVSSARKIVVQDAFTSGGAQADRLDTESHFQLNDIVNWSAGKHSTKFGLNIPDWSRRGIDDFSNFGGTFFFSSLEDYGALRPYAFRQQQGSGHVTYWQKELGLFLQDEYRLRPSLSLSLGLRYDWQNYLSDHKDFAPRIAFAFGLGKSRKTVLRGGSGIFYDRTGAGPIGDLLLYNGERLKSFLITDPSFPDPFQAGAQPASLPTNVVRFDPKMRKPYSVQYSVGVERQLARRTTLALTYNGARGIGLFRSHDINAPLPPQYLQRPNPAWGTVQQLESAGRQVSDSIEITLRGEITRLLSGLLQYTVSRTENNTGGISWYPANQYDLSGEWGRADFDQRSRLTMLESFHGGKLLDLGVGLTVTSGKPYTLTTGEDLFHTGLANARPPGVRRNTLVGPGYADLDLRWSHDFDLSKVRRDKGPVVTVAVDAFNALNEVNYSSYIGNLSSPSFGKPVSALPSRRMQLTMRLKF